MSVAPHVADSVVILQGFPTIALVHKVMIGRVKTVYRVEKINVQVHLTVIRIRILSKPCRLASYYPWFDRHHMPFFDKFSLSLGSATVHP